MAAFNSVVEYLKVKVGKTHPTHPKANTGAQMLRLYPTFEEEAEVLVDRAIHIIQEFFTRDDSSNPAGTAKLTSLSKKIGSDISRRIKHEPVPVKSQLRLGDLFIEALYNCGYVDLYYPQVRDGSHIVSASAQWEDLGEIHECKVRTRLYATTPDKPEKIKGPIQNIIGVDYPIVKSRFTKFDLSMPWVNAVDKLQRTGWRINQRVCDTMIANKEMFVSDIPFKDNESKEQKRRSKQVEWGYLTSKAQKLYNEDCFYQYVDLDYRGRIYYIESFMNFQGSDLSRGLMEFARAKPMTQEGLYWLSIHTASVFNMSYDINEIPEWCEEDYKAYLTEEELTDISVDKMSLNDRVQWTAEHMEEILESGTNLVLSDKAEKPISFLAACVEWADYFKAEADNRIHMTRLPIPVDGSNNGWQHLGAISKDPQTGELVGLVPVGIPKDFYVQTAKELIKINEDEDLKELLAKMPMKHIRKGISKRGSMTRAYSAGAKKIADNMMFDCEAEDFHETYGITKDHCKKLAKLLIKAIDNVCPGPLETMGYLQKLAAYCLGTYTKLDKDGNALDKDDVEAKKERRFELLCNKERTDEEDAELNEITAEFQSHISELVDGQGKKKIEWYSPSGFEVIYENWQSHEAKYEGTISGYTTYNKRGVVKHVLQVHNKDLPEFRGFMCGISPNFIHSHDAAHMALVIDQWNGDFGAVHDSFSTHACDVDRLLDLTKEAFVCMYEEDNYFDTIRFKLTNNEDDVEQPEVGELDIGGIHDSEFFFA